MIVALFMLCAVTYGAVKGFADLSAEGRMSNPLKNKANGWLSKWELDKDGKQIVATKRPWYYIKGFEPKFVEAFPYSSTMWVFVTDFWHFMNYLRTMTVMLMVSLADLSAIDGAILNFAIFFIVGKAIGFWLVYEKGLV